MEPEVLSELVSLLLPIPIAAIIIADLKLLRKYKYIIISGATEFSLLSWIKRSLIAVVVAFILSLLTMLISSASGDPYLISTLFFVSVVMLLGILAIPWMICGVYLLINLSTNKNNTISKKLSETQTEKKKLSILRILFWIAVPVTIIIANLLDDFLGLFVLLAALGAIPLGLICELIAYCIKHPQETAWVQISLTANGILAFCIYYLSIFIFNGWLVDLSSLTAVYIRLSIVSIIESAAIIIMNVIIYRKSKQDSENLGIKTKYGLMIFLDLAVYAVLAALLSRLFIRNIFYMYR